MQDTEPESAIFCHQERLQVMGIGHQPSHKAFNLHALPIGCARVCELVG